MENVAVLDNTTGIVSVLNGDNEAMLAHVATLLGPKFNMPKAGVIRSGIMKLKNNATPQENTLYERMVSEGATWDEIEKAIGCDGYGKSKLIPANVDYFTVRPGDCQNPKSAEEIYKLYADSDGKLRSFPVWFPVNEWWNIIPHSLRCFGQSGIRFRSAFRENGRRVCEFPVEVEQGKKVFGGRPWGERPCEPGTCKEYQDGGCKFGGTLQFYIPGIKGMGIWILPTTSWYSLVRIKSSLEAVADITGGRLARLFIDGKTPFVIRKVFDEISRIDLQTGKAVKQGQWLIDIECQIDMFDLAMYAEEKTAIKRGQEAISILNGKPTEPEPPTKPQMEHAKFDVIDTVEKEVEDFEPIIEEIPTEPSHEKLRYEMERMLIEMYPDPKEAMDFFQKKTKGYFKTPGNIKKDENVVRAYDLVKEEYARWQEIEDLPM